MVGDDLIGGDAHQIVWPRCRIGVPPIRGEVVARATRQRRDLTEHVMAFNDECVPDHTAEELRRLDPRRGLTARHLARIVTTGKA